MNDSKASRFKWTAPRFQWSGRRVLLAVTILIVYGSLYPFRFDIHRDISFADMVSSLRWVPTQRGDSLANILLYIPFGLGLIAAFKRSWHWLIRLVFAALAGAALSLLVEALQVMESARVGSLSDVVLDTISTVVGAIVAVLYQLLGVRLNLPGLFRSQPNPVSLGFIVLWLGSRLVPFVPSFDLQKIKDALKPLLFEPQIGVFDAVRYMVGWLVLAYAVRRLWKPSHSPWVLVLMVLGTQCARIVVEDKTLNPSELVGLVAMFLLLPLLARTTPAYRLLFLVWAVAFVVVAQGLEPWQFTSMRQGFYWLPFSASIAGAYEFDVLALIEKSFWYGSLVWLLSQRNHTLARSTVIVALLMAAIEFAQMWLPGRTPEITDPLLVLFGGCLLGLLAREPLK